MIDLSCYNLAVGERRAIQQHLDRYGSNPSLKQLWALMDEAWERHNCTNDSFDPEPISRFYRDPVWLLNGIFTEQDEVSIGHRNAITSAVVALAPERVVDFGGGFGTLARLLASALPRAQVAICEPYPPRHGVESCKAFSNISFVPELTSNYFDVLVSTDVLEHVPDPLTLLASMVDAVRPGGHLFIANCFYPVIACHLPCTFHLRHSFDSFCQLLGLEVVGVCEGSHATIYRRTQVIQPDWKRLRQMEHRSQRHFNRLEWRERHITPWRTAAAPLFKNLFYFPRKLISLALFKH